MEKVIAEVNWCKEVKKRRLRMTKKNEQDFDEAEECHICGKAYYEDDIHVRDHCHMTGKYRGLIKAASSILEIRQSQFPS